MKKMTLPKAFAELREAKGMTLIQIAKKCDLAESTIWKIENGRSIRWETVHLVLAIAFNVQPGTSAYESFNHLWQAERQKMAEAQGEDFAVQKLSSHAAGAVKKFRDLVRDLDETTTRKVIAAATRAAR